MGTPKLQIVGDPGDFKGDSAYQVAVNNGFKGTEAEWLESLKYSLTDGDKTAIANEVINLLPEAEGMLV